MNNQIATTVHGDGLCDEGCVVIGASGERVGLPGLKGHTYLLYSMGTHVLIVVKVKTHVFHTT